MRTPLTTTLTTSRRTRALTRRRFLGLVTAGAGAAALGRLGSAPSAARGDAGAGPPGTAAATRRTHLRLKALDRAALHAPHDWAG